MAPFIDVLLPLRLEPKTDNGHLANSRAPALFPYYNICLPLAFHLTGGEASDSRNFEILLDLGPDIAPRAAITDKGYDAKANRDGARKRGICPVIPYKSNAIDRPAFFPKILYKARARIEQAVGKLKRFKRIALRCEKTAQNYASFVALALGFILIKSVHTT